MGRRIFKSLFMLIRITNIDMSHNAPFLLRFASNTRLIGLDSGYWGKYIRGDFVRNLQVDFFLRLKICIFQFKKNMRKLPRIMKFLCQIENSKIILYFST